VPKLVHCHPKKTPDPLPAKPALCAVIVVSKQKRTRNDNVDHLSTLTGLLVLVSNFDGAVEGVSAPS
ncbi:MAG: hypothetical protein QF918_09850, partial [Pirellulaceae bacterium]|nr:hypothetical protein [Pirellulaceae bacterium]